MLFVGHGPRKSDHQPAIAMLLAIVICYNSTAGTLVNCMQLPTQHRLKPQCQAKPQALHSLSKTGPVLQT